MNIKKSGQLVTLLTVTIMCFLWSCEKDTTSLGANIIGAPNFNSSKATYAVTATTKKLKAVKTNNLSLYQLGRFEDPVYGMFEAQIASQISLPSNNPTFGTYSQSIEDIANTDGNALTINENETVTRVLLSIPFFVNTSNDADDDGVDDSVDADPNNAQSDTDNDGLTDIEEKSKGTDPLNPDTDGDGITDNNDTDTAANIHPKVYTLDSIIGNKNALFNVKVEQLTYYLRDLDPDTNFQQAQEYYSNADFSSYTGELLFDGQVEITNKETIIYNEDNPDTDTDESKTISQRLAPGILVELNKDFFQKNLLDKEGEEELLNNTNFKNFVRGLYITTHSFSDNILLLLNQAQAKVIVEYQYDKVDNKGTTDDTSDDVVITRKSITPLSMAPVNGNIKINNVVNTFTTTTSDISNNERLYLKGGQGSYVEVILNLDETTENDPEGILTLIKNGEALINEAYLTFYIDREALDAESSIEPQQLYLYKIDDETETRIDDYLIDLSQYNALSSPFINYGGNLIYEKEKGIYYKFRITEHLTKILKDNNENNKLGIAITANVEGTNTTYGILEDNEKVKIPINSIVTPTGTVLIGSNITDTDKSKQLQLEVLYTKIDN